MTAIARPQRLIVLLAAMQAFGALSIDLYLPGLPAIAQDLGSPESDIQLTISVFLVGFFVGMLFYGPLSDSIGRKPAIYIGLVVFIIGSVISAFASTYDVMLFGRFLQGFGVAGPRTVSTALVRDQYAGREMARIMSFVITVFILVPALAPTIGAGLLMVGTWENIFYTFIVMAVIGMVWMGTRQPETLPVEKRIPFSFGPVLRGTLEALRNRRSAGYMAVAGLAFACLIAYLNTAKLLFLDIYGVDEMFPLYFAMLALAIGAASIVNGKIVVKYGMSPLMQLSLAMMIFSSGLFLTYLLMTDGHPPFALFMGAMIVIFFFMGILFGNANAMAMEPMGHIAGIASSVIGAGTTFISMTFGAIIGQFYNQTLIPIIGGFTVLAVSGYLLMMWIEKKKEAYASFPNSPNG
jgi:DHA1 family bicyclomycin/chloramphenicol resistance-like MFS transporter